MTREEAIRKLRQWSLPKETMEILGELVPELVESEDERIRKHLIEIVETYWGTTNDPGKAADLAYLEKQKDLAAIPDDFVKNYKLFCENGRREVAVLINAINGINEQKEQKPAHTAKEMWKEMRLEIYAQASGNRHEPNCSDDSTKMFSLCDIDEIFEKIDNSTVEQRPAEWSEDYREEDIQTRFAFYTYKDDPSVLYLSNVFVEEASRNHGFGTRILKAAEKAAEAIGAITIRLKVKQDSPANAWYRKHGYGYVTFEDGYDWLEKNLEYLKPAKQEWSEGDEECRKEIIEYIEQRLGDGTSGQALWKKWHSWLKSLRPQPKQEWNEENKRIFQHCLVILHDYGYDDWFKSICSQPKQEWDEECKRKIVELKTFISMSKGFNKENRQKAFNMIDSLRPQPNKDIYQAAKHDLAIKFMNYLDENRPEGKMSLSNAECEDIDKAFKENDWAKIIRYYKKYGRRN